MSREMSEAGPLVEKLPAEVRSMILGDCIASGHPEFMRVCRALQKDGKAIIFKEGIHRTCFGAEDDEGDNAWPLNYEDARSIQNVCLRVDTTSDNATIRAIKMWRFYFGPQISHHPGKRCEILFKVDCTLDVALQDHIHTLLECFVGFEILILWIEIDTTNDFEYKPCSCTVRKNGAHSESMWDKLEDWLGKAQFKK